MNSSQIIYTSIPAVISSCTSIQAQLTMIDTILVGMLTAITTANLTGHFDSYKLDTGQTKNEVIYRNILELQKAYEAMFKTKQMVIAQLNINQQGRRLQLVDGRNFTGGRWNGNW